MVSMSLGADGGASEVLNGDLIGLVVRRTAIVRYVPLSFYDNITSTWFVNFVVTICFSSRSMALLQRFPLPRLLFGVVFHGPFESIFFQSLFNLFFFPEENCEFPLSILWLTVYRNEWFVITSRSTTPAMT